MTEPSTTAASPMSLQQDVTDAGAPAGSRRPRRAFRLPPYSGPLVALVLMCVVLSLFRPFFFSTANITNVLVTNAPLMIVAIGMTIAMISGGFDLSVGATLAATGITLHLALTSGLPGPVAILVALLTGVALGALVNGPLIAGLKLNFFVVTLGTMTTLTGVVYVVSGGQTKTIDSDAVFTMGNGELFGIPVPIVVIVLAFAASWLLLNLTPLGRNIYAVGGSREAARLSGIRVAAITITVYAVCGLLASVAGVVQAGLLTAASPTVGTTIALTAGAAVLLGGTSFSGGSGTVTGTVVGVLVIAVLQNGLGLFGVASYWQDVLTGFVLIVAVALDQFHRVARRRAKAPVIATS
ncbi:ABC transporter permease [Geodermatophilus sp. CPCC 206100]|uniref:ABC transporter permease n=1 Tax=Geodermatophilus sp. CPCC 206100 TaxID=3020054 RepID=UPI003B00014F